MNDQVHEILDGLRFRTFDKVYNSVKSQIPTITKKELRKIIIERKKDKHLKRNQVRPYEIKIFSPVLNTWFMDLLDNGAKGDLAKLGKENIPRYWHIFIGTNNRYAVAQPLNSKNAADIKQSLITFINKYHPAKLTSDQEKAFMEKLNIELMKENNVLLQTVPEQNHSTLAIIDRFIRTLRDMNRPVDGEDKQSTDDEFKTFDINKMNKLINVYNNTFHSTIKCSPKEMFDDKDKEKEFIFKCMEKRDKQKRIEDFELKDNEFVRYVISRDPMNKKRYNVSNESYKIAGKEGNHYILEAEDGTTMIKPRFQLIKSDVNKYKQAKTVNGAWNGVLKEIISYDKRTNRYKVKFDDGKGGIYIDTIPVSYLRGRYPTRMTKLEKEFFDKNK
jgi:hypothetical protein